MGAELFHAERRTDRQTDMTKLIVSFRNFANAPRKRIAPWLAWAGTPGSGWRLELICNPPVERDAWISNANYSVVIYLGLSTEPNGSLQKSTTSKGQWTRHKKTPQIIKLRLILNTTWCDISLLKTYKWLQTEFVAVPRLMEGQFLKYEQTWNKGNPWRFGLETQGSVMSIADGELLELPPPPQKN